MRKTKIICTLGPACRDEKTLVGMIKNGMNVARLNFSHQTHDFHRENIETVKRVRKQLNVPLAIMLDTKGPEIRTGVVEGDGVMLVTGNQFTLTTLPVVGDATRCYVNCDRLCECLKQGDRVLIDDGKIELSVLDITNTEIKCLIVNGGKLGNTRGVNIPDVHINMPFISEKDASDLKFGVEQGIDLVAASFVRTKQDVLDMRAYLDSVGGKDVKIIAKIENRFGIEYFDDILSVSDGIMVARGDMGVEVPFEKLPAIQKTLIKKCFLNGKMAITATQMLESMIENASPTRAEISDVANAVFDSTSAVMLSGETAIGKNPAAVVGVMAKICETAEKDAFKLGSYVSFGEPGEHGSLTDAICSAANVAANAVGADAVIAVTDSGDTARNMSKYRPNVSIIGATYNMKSYHQLSVNWGVIPMLTERQKNTDELFSHAVSKAVQNGLLRKGDKAVITAGSPVGISGKTNTLKIVEV